MGEVTEKDTEMIKVFLKKYTKIKPIVVDYDENESQEKKAGNEFYQLNSERIRLVEWAIGIISDEDYVKQILEYRFLQGKRLCDAIVRFPVYSDKSIIRKTNQGIIEVTENIKARGKMDLFKNL